MYRNPEKRTKRRAFRAGRGWIYSSLVNSCLQGEEGYPYGMPMTHWYNEKDGKIYFHGAKSGHKIDAIKNCDKVSFCVMDEGYRKEGEWALNIRSVIVFGRLRIVEEPEKVVEICTNLCKKFTDDKAYVEHELKHSGPAVHVPRMLYHP